MSNRRYDLLAVDLDGTLLAPDGRITPASKDAIDRARADGLEVVICTGRAYVETEYAIAEISAHIPADGRSVAPVITTGGAAVVDAATDTLMHAWRLESDLVERICDRFHASGRAPLILKHRGEAGYDYAILDFGPLEYPTQLWFQKMPLEVRYLQSLEEDDHIDLSLRIGFAAMTPVMRELAEPIMAEFSAEAFMQYFSAVGGSHDADPKGDPNDRVQLLEVFHPEVSKWRGIHTLASAQGIPDGRVAAIGDEINDLAMIRHAGLGIAMGNAVEPVKRIADRHTESFAQDGLANAIDRILDGEW